MSDLEPLRRSELPLDTIALARFLIGKRIVRATPEAILSGRIVETEAYPVGDRAGHAYLGQTPGTRSLFLSRGHAYVYLAYGTSIMLNVTSERAGVGAGVLIRALEPLEGIVVMEHNRGTRRIRDLARGPGRLSRALMVDRGLDGADLCREGPLSIVHDDSALEPEIGMSTRIGLSHERDRLLRFFAAASPFVSGPKRLNR
jgi:DNA-3-methyladenine glycosylase